MAPAADAGHEGTTGGNATSDAAADAQDAATDATDAGARDAALDAGSRLAPNPIPIENALPGTAAWALTKPATQHEVEGYASTTSTKPDADVELFVNVSEKHSVHWELYRLGYYAGLGGRLVATGDPASAFHQADCPADAETGLIECTWQPTFVVHIAPEDVSGYYLFKLVRDDGFESYVPLIVREPVPRAPLVVQASVATWQAYNLWGGTSLYANELPVSDGGYAAGRALRVSFDRPYAGKWSETDLGPVDLIDVEQWMVRWVEKMGYDVAYVTNVDMDEDPDVLLGRKLFLDSGHDEYWSLPERDAVTGARDNGVSLAFFSANSAYWRIRLEPSSSGKARRIVTCYKNPALDPEGNSAQTTTKYRSPPHAQPEDALIGQMYELSGRMDGYPIVVTNPTHWVYSGTGVSAGDTLSHSIGWEWDHVFDDGNTPSGLEVLAHSEALGSTGTEGYSDVTVYYPSPSSFVFAAGTIEWSWGLGKPGYEDSRVERMTENVLARAGLLAELSTHVEPRSVASDVGTSPSVTLLAGNGAAGLVDDKGAAAEFDAPAGAAADANGNIYVTDTRNNRIRKIAPDGTVTTVAGHGHADAPTGPRFANGDGATATFSVPTGIAVGADGMVYISDTHNHRIRAMTPDGVVTTFAGSGVRDNSDAADPRKASFNYPRGIAFAPDGSLYVADSGNSSIRRIGVDGVTTVVQAEDELDAVAVGPDGSVYVAGISGTVSILQSGKLVPIVDVAGVEGDLAGPGDVARLRPADGLAVDGDSLIVSDCANYKIRRVALSGDHSVTTLAGDGRAGADLGTGATAHVVTPRGIAVTASGYVVADSGNNRILQIAR